MNTKDQSPDTELDSNADLDTSEVPELGADFFATAILTSGSEDLIGVVQRQRAIAVEEQALPRSN